MTSTPQTPTTARAPDRSARRFMDSSPIVSPTLSNRAQSPAHAGSSGPNDSTHSSDIFGASQQDSSEVSTASSSSTSASRRRKRSSNPDDSDNESGVASEGRLRRLSPGEAQEISIKYKLDQEQCRDLLNFSKVSVQSTRWKASRILILNHFFNHSTALHL